MASSRRDIEPPQSGASMNRRGAALVGRFFAAHPIPAGISVVGAVAYAAAAVGATMAFGWATDTLVRSASRPDAAQLWVGVSVVMAVGCAKGVAVVVRRYFAAMFEARMQVTLRRGVVDKYVTTPLSFFQSRPTGELLAHADADVAGTTMLIKPLPFSIGLVALVVFALINLVSIDWTFAAVAIVLFPMLTIINKFYTNKMEVPSASVQQRMGDVSAVAHESFDGALVVRTLGLRDRETQRFAEVADRLRNDRIEVARLRSSFEPLFDLLPSLGTLGLIVVGSWRISTGAVSPGQLVGAAALFSILAFPMRVFGFFLEEVPRAVVSVERVDAVLAQPDDADGDVVQVPAPGWAGPLLEFREVGYSYPDGTEVLSSMSFSVGAHETVALVGSTAAGKSTVVSLAARLGRPTSGTVRLHGIDVNAMSSEALSAEVCVVFQEPFLFAGTVRDNVTLGDSEPSLDERFEHAIARAHIAHLDRLLPAGWDTVLGERGVTVSCGQRQRIALARALYHDPALLILDDATSAVDPTIEAKILADLRTLRSSLLVVAHRLSTILLADRVVYLDGGRVVASGTHVELLSLPGYRALVTAYEHQVDDEVYEGDLGDDEVSVDVVESST